MKLYELDYQFRNFDFQFDEETGEITNFDEYERLSHDRDAKIEALGIIHKEKLAEIKALEDEKKYLESRIKKAKKSDESLKNYISTSLNGEKFKTPKVTMSFRRSKSVEIMNEDMFCLWALENGKVNFVNTKVEYSPIKKAIKEAIENGEEVNGCELIEKQSISIK